MERQEVFFAPDGHTRNCARESLGILALVNPITTQGGQTPSQANADLGGSV